MHITKISSNLTPQHKYSDAQSESPRNPPVMPEATASGPEMLPAVWRVPPTATHQPALGRCQGQTQPSAFHTCPLSWTL